MIRDLIAVALWHRHEDAHHIGLCNPEQLCARAAIARVNQVTDIGQPLGDHAVEGRDHLLEALQLLQPRDIRHRGLGAGFHRRQVLGVLVHHLLRHRIGRAQILVAFGRDPGKRQVRLALFQRGARLGELLVDLGVEMTASNCPCVT